MHEKLDVKSAKIRGNKTLYAIALILMLAFSAVIAIIPYSVAQVSEYSIPTPSEWRTLINETPDGAYRDASGVTKYPQTTSPGGTEDKTGFSAGIPAL